MPEAMSTKLQLLMMVTIGIVIPSICLAVYGIYLLIRKVFK